jgi:hypothetical protein
MPDRRRHDFDRRCREHQGGPHRGRGARDHRGGHARSICSRRTQKTSHPAVREVIVTDTVSQTEKDWPQLSVISIAPLIAGAVQRSLANGSLGDCNEKTAQWPPHWENRT